jgi:hypothetical protein
MTANRQNAVAEASDLASICGDPSNSIKRFIKIPQEKYSKSVNTELDGRCFVLVFL